MSTEYAFTKVPNSVLDALWKWNFSNNEQRIILFIIRKTIGYNKVSESVSVNGIAKQLKISERTAMRCINSLIDREIIVVKSDHTYRSPRKVAINTDASEWRGDTADTCHESRLRGDTNVRSRGDTADTCHESRLRGDTNVRSRGDTADTSEVTRVSPIKRKYIKEKSKENLEKESDFLSSSDSDWDDDWDNFGEEVRYEPL